MSGAAAVFALVALLPAMTGSVVPEPASNLTVPLCRGGSIELPAGAGDHAPPSHEPRCNKACHAERRRIDPKQ